MEQYRYSVDVYDTGGIPPYEKAFVYSSPRKKYNVEQDWSLEALAEACAEDFLYDHDGWDHPAWNNNQGSLLFYIWTSEHTFVKFDIWLEYLPSFIAQRVDDEECEIKI